MKDINGNEYKVGCVYNTVPSGNGDVREVVKVLQDGVIYWNNIAGVSDRNDANQLKRFRILHYRELAPDKNGKMICEGDTLSRPWGRDDVVVGHNGRYFTFQSERDEFNFHATNECTFVSRPTENTKKMELLAKADELIAKANEMKKKAEEM